MNKIFSNELVKKNAGKFIDYRQKIHVSISAMNEKEEDYENPLKSLEMYEFMFNLNIAINPMLPVSLNISIVY